MDENNIQINENNNLNNENEKNDENESKINEINNNNNENVSNENEINNNSKISNEKESESNQNQNYEKDPILNKNYVIKLNDLNKFKDDILTHIYLIESKINNTISNQQEQLSTNTLNLTNKITVLEQKNSHLSDTFSKLTFDTSKISELLTFKKKAENELISQKIHLDSSIKDLSNSIYKHDKIILENLNVPGQIGTGCKYKNLSEYLSLNIKSMKNILDDQKIIQDKLKEHEKYIDNKSHQLKILIDEVILQNKNYTDIKFQLYSNDNENLIKIFNDKVMQLKIENVKQAQEMIKKTEEVLKGLSNLEQIKNDVFKKLNDHLFIYKTDLKEALEKYHKSEKEFKQIKYRFGTMIEFIKDIRFRKNLENYVNNNNKRNFNDNRNFNDRNLKKIRKNEIKELTVRLKVNRKKSIDSAELKNVDLNYDAKTGNNNNNHCSDDEDYEENKKKVSNIFRRISKNKITFIQDDDFIHKKLNDNNNDNNNNNNDNNDDINDFNDNNDVNSSNVSNKDENDSNDIIINNNNENNLNNFSSENNNKIKVYNKNYKNLKLDLNDDFNNNNNNKNIINTENNNFVKNYKLTLNEEKNELPIINNNNNNNNNKSTINSNNKSNNNKNRKLILFSKENSIEEDKEKIDYKIVNLELKTNLEKFYENEKNKNNFNKNVLIQKEKNFINLNNKEFNKTFYNKNSNKKSLLSNLTFIKSLNNNNNNNNKISQKNKKFNVILVNKNRLNFDNLNGIIIKK